MLNRNHRSGQANETNKQPCMSSPTVDSMLDDVLHALGRIDLQHHAELGQLEKSSTDDDKLKNHIRGRIIARHRERREPYVELLTELRKHQPRLAGMA